MQSELFNPELLKYKRLFGLIGYPLGHSFSKKYFTQKFQNEGITEAYYELFPISEVSMLPKLFDYYPNLVGLNVTIPYKKEVIPYLVKLSAAGENMGAINTIKRVQGNLEGHNTDVYGFEVSLRELIDRSEEIIERALILGTGGSSKAVEYVLQAIGIPWTNVSRTARAQIISYDMLDQETLSAHRLIINTTPLGMAPNIDKCPAIPYQFVGAEHLFFDLVYNPEQTLFLTNGHRKGAKGKNGLEMLYLQAEKSWAIWNTDPTE